MLKEADSIFHGLKQIDGVWIPSSSTKKISYPSTGNASCFQVEDESFWFTHRNKCIQYLIKKFHPKGFIVDIGGGNGFVSKGIAETNLLDVVLLEPGMEGILNAKTRGVEHLICSTLEETSIKENTLPAVGLFDVVEHIEFDQAFLKKIYKLMAPGGYLFLTVPAHSILWSKEDIEAGHFRRYSLGKFKNQLRQEGFEIAFASYLFMFLVFPIFFLRTIPTFFSKKESKQESVAKDHAPGVGRFIIDSILKIELFLLKSGLPLPFGGSCIVVAKKN